MSDDLQLSVERVMKFLEIAEGKYSVVDGLPAGTLDLEEILNAIHQRGWELITILQNADASYWKMIFRRRSI